VLVRWTVEQLAARALEDLAPKPGFDARAARELVDGHLAGTLDHGPLVRDALRGERASMLYVVRRWIDGESPLEILEITNLDQDPGAMNALVTSWIWRPLVYGDAMRTLDLYERALELVEAPPQKASAAADALVEEYEDWFLYFFTNMMRRIPGKVFSERLRHLARIRITRVGLALLQRREETGAWPTDLDAAIPLVDAETLTDPYTDKRLQYEPGVRLEAAVPIPAELEGEFREDRRIVWRFK